jgi:hypothetical protein
MDQDTPPIDPKQVLAEWEAAGAARRTRMVAPGVARPE